MLHKKGDKNMKKRFTIMLEEETIRLIKALYDYYTPTTVRSNLEKLIKQHTISELSYHESKKLTRYIKYEK